MAVILPDRLERGRRVVAGVLAERAFHHRVVHVDFELDHDLGGRRHLDVAGLAVRELDRRAAQPAGDLPVVGLVVHLHLAGVGEDRVDADDQRRLRLDAHLLALGQVLAEAVERLRRERHRVLVEDQEAVVPDVGHAGLGVLRHHDAGRDVGAAVLRAVGRDREAPDIDILGDHHLVAGRAAAIADRRLDRIVQPVEHLLGDVLLVGLECQQGVLAAGIHAADQRKLGAVLVEARGFAALGVGVLERLADVGERDRLVDVDQLAVLAQHIEELTEIVERHFRLSPRALLLPQAGGAPHASLSPAATAQQTAH